MKLIEDYKDLIIDAADNKKYLRGEVHGEQLSSPYSS